MTTPTSDRVLERLGRLVAIKRISLAGANPARVSYGAHTVSRPLAPEEDIGLALLQELGPAGRSVAVVATEAPADIRTATKARAQPELLPLDENSPEDIVRRFVEP